MKTYNKKDTGLKYNESFLHSNSMAQYLLVEILRADKCYKEGDYFNHFIDVLHSTLCKYLLMAWKRGFEIIAKTWPLRIELAIISRDLWHAHNDQTTSK